MVMYSNEFKYYPACTAFNSSSAFAIWPTRLRAMMRTGGVQGGVSGSKSLGGVEKAFWCPANQEGFQWQLRYSTPGGAFADTGEQGYGYASGELLLNVSSVPFSYGYNDWGGVLKINGHGQDTMEYTEQLGLGGDLRPNTLRRELGVGRVRNGSEMIAIADNTTDGRWDYNIDPNQPEEWPGKVHRNGSNVLFVDGHVDWYLQKDLVNITPNDAAGSQMNRMWNNDNRVHDPNSGVKYGN
jgi:prepilin-type processing-associated H-X9-DG protein